MNAKWISAMLVALLFIGALSLAAQQALPAPPPGFVLLPQRSSVQAMRAQGVADTSMSERETDSSCKNAEKIGFTFGWQASPGADKSLALMAKSPQDPAREMMGTRTEPAGKGAYKKGLMEWKKRTLVLGTGCEPGFVTYEGLWLGYFSGKLINITITNVSSKDTGQKWVDEYIDKMVALVSAGK